MTTTCGKQIIGSMFLITWKFLQSENMCWRTSNHFCINQETLLRLKQNSYLPISPIWFYITTKRQVQYKYVQCTVIDRLTTLSLHFLYCIYCSIIRPNSTDDKNTDTVVWLPHPSLLWGSHLLNQFVLYLLSNRSVD